MEKIIINLLSYGWHIDVYGSLCACWLEKTSSNTNTTTIYKNGYTKIYSL